MRKVEKGLGKKMRGLGWGQGRRLMLAPEEGLQFCCQCFYFEVASASKMDCSQQA